MNIKRLLVPPLLAASLLLAACSGAAGAEPESSAESSQPVEYSWESLSSPIEYTDGSIRPLCTAEAGFYALSEVKAGELIPDSVLEEAEEKGEEPVNDGRYDIYELRLLLIGFDGELSPLEKYAQLPSERNSGGWDSFSSTSGLDGLALNEEGELYALEHTYSAGYSKAEEGEEADSDGMAARFSEKWYLRRLDPLTGRILSKKEIINEDAAFFSGEGMRFIDGRLWLTATYEGGSLISAVNTDGTVERSIVCDGYVYSLFTLNDGRLAVLAADGAGELFVYCVDTGNYSLEKLYEISGSVESVSSGSGDFSFYYTDGLYFCGWTGDSEQSLFSWTEVNVNSGRISSDIAVSDDGAARFITGDSDGGYSLFTVTKVPRGSETGPVTVTLASSDADYCLKDAVADFNRSHEDCRVVITGDFDSADIIDLTGLDYRKLASQGRIADLYPYIDSDGELSRSDFLSSIPAALEVDGKLCMSFSSFSIDTVLGAASVTGDKTGWSYEEYYSALGSLGAGSRAFDAYTTGYDILETCLSMDAGRYIDWSAGACSFDSEDFRQLLEFALSVQKSYSGAEPADDYSPDIELYRGRQLLQRTSLYDFDDVQRAGYEFGRTVSYKGYPGLSGTGSGLSLISLGSGANFAISQGSSRKDEAWRFIRVFFTEEYQRGMSCFPARAGLFNERMEAAMEIAYLQDDEGKTKYNKDTGEPIALPAGTMYLSNFIEIKYYPLSREGADRFSALTGETTNIVFRNDELLKIISSAVKPYFEGAADVQSAASAVQDAVTRWMSR